MPHCRPRLTRLSLSSRRIIFIFGGSRQARITSWLCRSGARIAQSKSATSLRRRCRECTGCSPRASCAALTLLAALRGRRLRAPRHCCPLTALPPPPKCSGNEEGAKMTGSICDFASRTCASTTVPRELALGAGSSGMIRVSTATSSSAATAQMAKVSARSPPDARVPK